MSYYSSTGDEGEDSRKFLCDAFACKNVATQRVRVRISPTTVTYADLCDECAVDLEVHNEEMDEYTELYLGHDALIFSSEDLLNGLCCCRHTKPYHWPTSCVGCNEHGERCRCRGFTS